MNIFLQIVTVFKYPLKGKAAMQILKSCPFPSLILELGIDGVLFEIKKAVKKTVGRKKAQQLVETAKNLSRSGLWVSISKAEIRVDD